MPPHVRPHHRNVLPRQRQNLYTTPPAITRHTQVSGTKPSLIMRSEATTSKSRVPSYIPIPITQTTDTGSATTSTTTTSSTSIPTMVATFPRPKTKPRLLTDYEYETMWNADMNTLRLGIILSLNAPEQTLQAILVRKGISAIRLAVEDVNRLQVIPGINVSLVVRDSQDPALFTNTGGLSALAAVGELMNAKVGGVIGDTRSDLTRFEALITSSVNLWQCSYASADTSLSNYAAYPSLFRTIPTTIVMLDAVLEMLISLGWKRILVVYDITTLGWSGREYITERAAKMGIYILGYQPLVATGDAVDPTYEAVKESIRSYQSRVQLVITGGNAQLPFIREMSDSGFFSPEYGWVTVNDISDLMQNERDIREYDGMIVIDNGWDLDSYEPFDTFLDEWMALNATDYPGAGDPKLNHNEGMAYSCVMMIAEAYGKLVRDSISNRQNEVQMQSLIQDILSGDYTGQINISQTFRNVSYEGPNGPIALDSNGDRTSGYYVMMSMQNGTTVQFGSSFAGSYIQTQPPFFKEGHPNLPNDTPPGAIHNPQWNNVGGIIYGVFCITGIILTLASMVAVIYFRKHIVIKAASPTFCLCEIFGVLLIMVWCILHVGIPDEAVCIAQALVLPLGVTFLAGSLTIKNYRIYRIFNSVTATNLAFQTRVLIRFLGLATALCLIPLIVQAIIDPPKPEMLNIQSSQWIRCSGKYPQPIWTSVDSIVPMLLILFGVFLAIKTRNVVFLWNEAKQISIVIYNVLFFSILVTISRAFPISLYQANFYIATIGTLFVVLVALFVLFAPKFWNIWNDLRKRRGKKSHFNNHSPQRGISDMHGGHGHSINACGPGGVGGVDTGGAIFGRMPEDLKLGLPPTAQPVTEGEQQEQQEQQGQQQQDEMASTNSAVGDLDLSNIALDRLEPGTSLFEPSARDTAIAMTVGGLQSESQSESRTESRPESQSSFIEMIKRHKAKSKDNPLNVWMNARVPRKSSVAVGNMLRIDDDIEISENQGGAEAQRPMHEPNSSIVGYSEGEAEAAVGVNGVALASTAEFAPEGPFSADMQSGTVFESSSLETSHMLDSYVFLLPILVTRNRLARILSHWSMTTIILIPEAHAFLAVDSTNGRSTSYLMLSMTQIQSDDEPMIQVTTRHAGTLLIRFSNQARLAYWMSLFSQSDLQALDATTFSVSAATSVSASPGTAAYSSSSSYSRSPFTSGYGGYSDHNGYSNESARTGVRRRSVNIMNMSAARTSDPSIYREHGSTSHRNKIFHPRPTELSPTIEVVQYDAGDTESEVKEVSDMTTTMDQGQEFSSCSPGVNPRNDLLRPEASIVDSDSSGNGIGSYDGDGTWSSTRDGMEHLGASNNVGLFENQNPLMNNTNKIAMSQDGIGSKEVQATTSSAIELVAPPHPDQAKAPDSPLASIPPTNPLAQYQHQLNSNNHIGDYVDGNDSDDLYDPEFGIGGIGRRRRNNGHRGRGSMRPPLSSSSVVSTSTQGHPIIPSPTVISAAAAAVSAGWSESEALTAAMVNPSVLQSQIDSQSKSQFQSQSRPSRRSSQASSITVNHSMNLPRLFSRPRRESLGASSVQTNASSSMWRSWGSMSSRGTTFSERVLHSGVSNGALPGSYSSAISTSNPATQSESIPMSPFSEEDAANVSQGSQK